MTNSLNIAWNCNKTGIGVHSFTKGACVCGQTYHGMLNVMANEEGYPDWEAYKWRNYKLHTHEDGGDCRGYCCWNCKERMCWAHLQQHKQGKHGIEMNDEQDDNHS